MTLSKIPPSSSLTDEQYIQIAGADGVITGYKYDAQTKTLTFKESQVIYPSFHGFTHISEDPVPAATSDTPGLMAPEDKIKLDTLIQNRIGVLGFMGAGFPDDGGWQSGDVIFAAGTDFISIERVGNIIRFTVDTPLAMSCSCEDCLQIFWVQDETATSAIRPPTCAGKLPDINGYGELRIYQFPESTIVDPNNAATTLNKKAQYPAMLFRRYQPSTAAYDLILKRDRFNKTTTEVGWHFTPNDTKVECVWYTGKDADGNQVRFDLEANSSPNLLGSLLYKGHLLTKQMAVITGYTSNVTSNNQYSCRFIDPKLQSDNVYGKVYGSVFTATNLWQIQYPENAASGTVRNRRLTLDRTVDILPVGTLVDIWYFKVGENATTQAPILRYFFIKEPSLSPDNLWADVGAVQFGDYAIAREELQPDAGSADSDAATQVSGIRDFESHIWGLTGQDDPFYEYEMVVTAGTEGADISQQHRAIFDESLPGLKVVSSENTPNNFSERPVYLWNRNTISNALVTIDIGNPNASPFTPYDILLRAKIDEHETRYMRVIKVGTVNGLHYIRVKGVHFHDLPPFGTVRTLHADHEIIFNYSRKFMYSNSYNLGSEASAVDQTQDDYDTIVLACSDADNSAYGGSIGDVVELLHQEYNSPCVRVECNTDASTGQVSVQFKVGELDMSSPYESDNVDDDADDYVRGLAAGYTVSGIYSQDTTFTGVGTKPTSSPSNFVIYDGGAQSGGTQAEFWNRLEIMLKGTQVWIWWNGLLVPPSTTLSANLDTPVVVNTPYFSLEDTGETLGKCGVRLWPGASVRRMIVKSQSTNFSEYTYGQLSIS